MILNLGCMSELPGEIFLKIIMLKPHPRTINLDAPGVGKRHPFQKQRAAKVENYTLAPAG